MEVRELPWKSDFKVALPPHPGEDNTWHVWVHLQAVWLWASDSTSRRLIFCVWHHGRKMVCLPLWYSFLRIEQLKLFKLHGWSEWWVSSALTRPHLPALRDLQAEGRSPERPSRDYELGIFSCQCKTCSNRGECFKFIWAKLTTIARKKKPQWIDKMLQRMSFLHLILYCRIKAHSVRGDMKSIGNRLGRQKEAKWRNLWDWIKSRTDTYCFYIGWYRIVNN